MTKRTAVPGVLLLLAIGLCGVRGSAQSVRPSPVRRVGGVHAQSNGESLSLSSSASSLSFTLVPGGPSAKVGLPLSVTWNVSQQRSLSVYEYFASSTAALSGGSPQVNIPSSAVSSTTVGSNAQTPFTGSSPFSGNSAVTILSGYSISGNSSGSGTVYLVIDCTNLPQLPAGTYTGVLYIQAQAI